MPSFFIQNGRGPTENDNFTHVSTSGKSVVDYMIVPYTELGKYSNFSVSLISDVIRIQPVDGAIMPDNSVLMCELFITEYYGHIKYNSRPTSTTLMRKTRIYDTWNIPHDVLNNERCRNALLNVIDSIKHVTLHQNLSTTFTKSSLKPCMTLWIITCVIKRWREKYFVWRTKRVPEIKIMCWSHIYTTLTQMVTLWCRVVKMTWKRQNTVQNIIMGIQLFRES